jgi:hypothetical protein
MAEPKSNHGQVNAASKQSHGCGVSKSMRRNSLRFHRWTCIASASHVSCDEALEGIGAKLSTSRTGEDRVRWTSAAFRQPSLEDTDHFRLQGRTPHLPPFPETANVSTHSEFYILTTQRGEFAVPHAGLNRHQEERTIPAANPCLGIRRRHQCGCFFLGEELHRSSLETLRRNDKNALALQAERGLSERNVAEEGVKRRETMVARAWPVASLVFQVFEELLQELRAEFLEMQRGRNPTETVLGELQQETEGVTVSRHGVGAGALLGYQPIREEPLEERRKVGGVHCSPPGTCTVPRRLVASASNSGTASIYQ